MAFVLFLMVISPMEDLFCILYKQIAFFCETKNLLTFLKEVIKFLNLTSCLSPNFVDTSKFARFDFFD